MPKGRSAAVVTITTEQRAQLAKDSDGPISERSVRCDCLGIMAEGDPAAPHSSAPALVR
jgi:hypothetical protein